MLYLKVEGEEPPIVWKKGDSRPLYFTKTAGGLNNIEKIVWLQASDEELDLLIEIYPNFGLISHSQYMQRFYGDIAKTFLYTLIQLM